MRFASLLLASTLFLASITPSMAQQATVFSIVNFPILPTPPGRYVPSVDGRSVPLGHDTWLLQVDTTGLPDNQLLALVMVQYHYSGVQLGVTGMPSQGEVTNPDGSKTQIVGGSFTGWIDDCGAPLHTTRLDRHGAVVHNAFLDCDLNRILGAYPDAARFLILSSPGYANVPSVTFTLN